MSAGSDKFCAQSQFKRFKRGYEWAREKEAWAAVGPWMFNYIYRAPESKFFKPYAYHPSKMQGATGDETCQNLDQSSK